MKLCISTHARKITVYLELQRSPHQPHITSSTPSTLNPSYAPALYPALNLMAKDKKSIGSSNS
ncbi:hypothetical protein KEJ17_00265 [Candidatus Bathyarchaeota archaeon]|nr:hypothetical protein [Candidatus Bathyarchaeota archaeon]